MIYLGQRKMYLLTAEADIILPRDLNDAVDADETVDCIWDDVTAVL